MPEYSHPLDKDKACAIQGEKSEDLFRSLLLKEGYEVRNATRQDQYAHVDLIATRNNQITRFDVKSRKRVSRQGEIQDQFIWVEIKNGYSSSNNPNGLGWLFGSADQIAFHVNETFITVDREKLVDLVKEKCNLRKVAHNANQALYAGYKRFGRQDLLTMLKTEDVLGIAKKIYHIDLPLTDSQNAPKIGA